MSVAPKRSLCMVGAFPPPVHGMAAINQAMRDFLVSLGDDPAVFNLSAAALSRAWHVRLRRSLQVSSAFLGYVGFLLRHRNVSVYLSLSGGYGQIYECVFISVARLLNARLFLHHHSFLYLNRPRALTRTLILLSGSDSLHVVLCKAMAQKLKAGYPSARRVMVLSNSAFLPPAAETPHPRCKSETLGFLGNIEEDKGILEFLDVIQQLRDEGYPVRALIAGPFHSKAAEVLVRKRMAAIGAILYVGPKYGGAKSEFLKSIDVLLYPTRNDAEPLTVLEAMGHGVPVVAWARGCIPEMLAAPSGCAIDSDTDYVSGAAGHLRHWQQSPREFSDKSRAAIDRYGTMRAESQAVLKELHSQMTSVQ